MAALINPVVSGLFRFKTSWPNPTAEKTLCDTETPDNQRNQETPVQTGLTGFSTLLKPLPTWRRSVFRWFVGPVFAASSAADADQGVEGAPNETGKVKKRSGYLEWEEYFMAIAFLSAMRSKDPVTQVGACIVNQDKKIVGTGYNGMPIGCSDDDLPWDKKHKSTLENKNLYVCHAELNAIVNKIEADVRGCTMYVGLFPCNECAKLIVQSGIKEVVYYSDAKAEKPEYRASKRLLDRAHVKYRQYKSEKAQVSKVLVDFDEPATKSA
ncbi:deoxycytidylate deaminase-like [Littorina saxatilis]|uniref:dCMP deaminase n=1 Tax=Littorina saxatilis TaxID=31220 RepID=A0AAN9G642_9CAEN